MQDPGSLSSGKNSRRIPPTNYLKVSKCIPLEGQYILDLALRPPPPSPGIVTDAEAKDRKDLTVHKNLTLHTTSGPITTEIWMNYDRSVKSKRVSVELCSDYGFVHAKLHDLNCVDGSTRGRPSLDIELRASYGDVSISLPSCFRGPITIRTTHERIALSRALENCTALISDVQGIRVYFVGERPPNGKWRRGHGDDKDDDSKERGGPLGVDELSIGGKHTGVRINWEGEEELPEMRPSGWQSFCSGTGRFFTTGRVW
ncbi:hypothetical protein F5148DRAFT_1171286 [Russula earlei]|uniref:Uncharacterized protein n=1 Tax=Russula earlei TaxID=71964 RepID=A0ACC0UI95_9AGAM|nr:hypothetical protein F5148DRAFT_1171286 [Russula earlei]